MNLSQCATKRRSAVNFLCPYLPDRIADRNNESTKTQIIVLKRKLEMSSESATFPRSPELLSRLQSRLLIVDVQEKLMPHIPVADDLIAHCGKLIRGAGLVGVPVFATEQYAKGLGSTVAELAVLLPDRPDKLRFSCAEALNWGTAAEQPDGRDQIVIAGIETHVCVLQTAFDLLSFGYRVFIPADAVASRKKLDWQFALRRLSDAGATICTLESVLFEWAEIAGTPEFKAISQLVKSWRTLTAVEPK